MTGRILRVGVAVVVLGLLVAAGGLVWTHLVVRRAAGPLPLVADILDLAKLPDVPVRVSAIEASRQPMGRATVLDSGVGPTPDAPYVMTFAAFVVEWADGRLLLIDAGMSRRRALEFGSILTRFAGAAQMEVRTTVAEALGDEARRVGGVLFTHLHVDHVEGVRELCVRAGRPLKVLMTPIQHDQWTFTTAEGRTLTEDAVCTERVRLGESRLQMPEGFPGVAIIPAGGHTPGSQIVVVATRDENGIVKRHLFIGDISNSIDGVRGDIPKPWLYRWIIVPEDDDRLGELRRYARALEREHGFVVVPSHDGGHLERIGMPAWGAGR